MTEVCPNTKSRLILTKEGFFLFNSKLLRLWSDAHESVDHRLTTDSG